MTNFDSGRPLCKVHWLGRVNYRDSWELQKTLSLRRLQNEIPDTLLLLEHPPTLTLGRNADPTNLLWNESTLRQQGIEVVQSDRGGDVTYHGPGQLVGYPILNLQCPPHEPNLHGYFRKLEAVLIQTLASFGVRSGRFEGYTGVWVGMESVPFAPEKIAAMGIRVSRWVTQHGFALNISPNLDHFSGIVPCGIREYGVTSLEKVLGRSIALEDISPEVVRAFGEVFGMEMIENRESFTP